MYVYIHNSDQDAHGLFGCALKKLEPKKMGVMRYKRGRSSLHTSEVVSCMDRFESKFQLGLAGVHEHEKGSSFQSSESRLLFSEGSLGLGLQGGGDASG